jgi:putative transposase
MPRKLVPRVPDTPYHISARSVNAEWFTLPMDTVWDLMSDYLYLVSHAFNCRIHAFVLMSNHFHLLLSMMENNMGSALNYLMRESSREMNRLTGRKNQTWGMRNHKTYLANPHYFINSYKYVYQNPIRAKICERVEDYPYSTLSGLLGKTRLTIPVVEDSILFAPDDEWEALEWLNKRPDSEAIDEMRRALRYSTFQTCRKTGRRSKLEDELL